MRRIEWDKESGGVLLTPKVTKDTLGISPRPVWFEELDLLGLDNSDTPIREQKPRLCGLSTSNITIVAN